jgi:DAACS family dicarboxylate/amino acid:cation (Na+ or H+) symporter
VADEKKKQKMARSGAEANAYEREQMTDLDDRTRDRPRGVALHTRILIGLVVGVVAGVLTYVLFSVPNAAGGSLPHPRIEWLVFNVTEPIGQLFLRLLLMIVVPLVFSSLVVGVAGIGEVRQLGRGGL